MTDKFIIKSKCLAGALAVTVLLAGCVSFSINGGPPKQETPSAQGTETQVSTEPEETDEKEDGEVTKEPETKNGNLIPGGDFNASNPAWGLYMESGGSASFDVSGGKLKLHIADPGKVAHAVQLYACGFQMLEGGKYHFSCMVTSDVERTFEWRIQINGGDYHPYCSLKDVKIGPESTELTCDFTMNEASDPAPRMCFNLGDEGKEQGLKEHNICIEKATLVLENAQDVESAELPGTLMDVNVNQIGYMTKADKRAVVRLDGDLPLSFDVVDISTGKSVYTGEVTGGINKGSSGDTVGYADFTSVTAPGRYRIDVENIGSSFEFSIGDDVYDEAFTDSLRMLYLQRCGCEIDSSAGDFAHVACHTDEARIYGGTRYIDVSGGWHDAGDYGRYTVPAAKTIADLLLAYELFPASFEKTVNIPESGNGMPDVLNEAKYELDWLFKMQADDGGVYHKVTGLNFDGFIKPEECTEKLYVLPESKTATADFAATMYMAARVYEKFDAEYAKRCISAADRAINVYMDHIDDRNYKNPADVLTGEYGDNTSADEFLWAIFEGYKTTGDKRFEKMLTVLDISRITEDGFGWDDMSGYAFFAYLTTKDPMKTSIDVGKRFFDMCSQYKDTVLYGESYGSTFTDDYPWGSNMYIANNGMGFLMAYSLTGESDYLLAAHRVVDYLFGTNCTSYCFLTGFGSQSPEHPHHRPSEAIGKAMKGMLVGGPDSYLEDAYAKAVLSDLPKARCYADSEQTYSCNEITIYWNSPLVFLLAGLR